MVVGAWCKAILVLVGILLWNDSSEPVAILGATASLLGACSYALTQQSSSTKVERGEGDSETGKAVASHQRKCCSRVRGSDAASRVHILTWVLIVASVCLDVLHPRDVLAHPPSGRETRRGALRQELLSTLTTGQQPSQSSLTQERSNLTASPLSGATRPTAARFSARPAVQASWQPLVAASRDSPRTNPRPVLPDASASKITGVGARLDKQRKARSASKTASLQPPDHRPPRQGIAD